MRMFFVIAFCALFALTACAPPDAQKKKDSDELKVDPENISFSGTNRIVIQFAPAGDLANKKTVKTTTISDGAIVKNWMKTLAAVPKKGPGLKAKLPKTAPEYKITFYRDTDTLGTLRMKAGKLDAPEGAGWDFYNKEDDKFIQLVKDSM